jgi:osmotically-inducible protein OsmY
MKYRNTQAFVNIIACGLLLATAASPALAQATGEVPSSQSVRSSGSSAEGVVSKAGEAIKDAYNEAATAVSDTAITTEIKAGLHENKATRSGDIQVHTNQGVVTLEGTVRSKEAISAAQKVAKDTSGVKEVTNELTMLSTPHR